MIRNAILAIILLGFSTSFARIDNEPLYWIKVKAENQKQRSIIANSGAVIEHIADDYVAILGTSKDLEALKKTNEILTSFEMTQQMMDFPAEDSKFHNYAEMVQEITALAANNPDIVKLDTLTTTYNNHQMYHLTISTDLANSHMKPGIVFMGGHHAREHVSIEMAIRLASGLVQGFRSGDANYQRLIQGREIHIIPMVNPDGAEYDIATGNYQMWRKNRRNNGDGTYGVDLNRNYGHMWGTGGSSKSTRSDVYMGPHAFSEPETLAIKNFIEAHQNINILLSYHTFSELILYPWGHKYESIENAQAFEVHTTMAQTMARWNRYAPQQSSDLYIASGDTTDWSFGAHGIISFTFELDPKNMWSGGFYPGEKVLDGVYRKNINPALYLIDYADNPYRVLEPAHRAYGLNSPLVK